MLDTWVLMELSTSKTVTRGSFAWRPALGMVLTGLMISTLTYLTMNQWAVALMSGALVSISMALGWLLGRHQTEDAGLPPVPEMVRPVADTLELSKDSTSSPGFSRAAIEATPNPVLIIDMAQRLIATNAAARNRFMIGTEVARFANVIRRPDLIDAVTAVLETGEARSILIETRVPVDRFERASIASFDAGGARFILIAIQDETEARMSERMRADFLANASHELRTPLAGIIGFIETLRGPAREDDVARDRFLEIMHLQADRMSRLISDLLSLSRIEMNEHVLPTGRSDLAAAIQEAVESLPPLHQERIDFVGSDLPLWVTGDWDEIQQIAVNLIDNALKYGGKEGRVSVSLSGWQTRDEAIRFGMREWDSAARLPLTSPPIEHERLYCTLRIEDTGPGIERQHLPRLSERFYRVEDTASGKSGTGLGLAIVKHIVNRHRGGLVVESELQRGSAFSVYLPQPLEIVRPMKDFTENPAPENAISY